jgi:hypothetical protein
VGIDRGMRRLRVADGGLCVGGARGCGQGGVYCGRFIGRWLCGSRGRWFGCGGFGGCGTDCCGFVCAWRRYSQLTSGSGRPGLRRSGLAGGSRRGGFRRCRLGGCGPSGCLWRGRCLRSRPRVSTSPACWGGLRRRGLCRCGLRRRRLDDRGLRGGDLGRRGPLRRRLRYRRSPCRSLHGRRPPCRRLCYRRLLRSRLRGRRLRGRRLRGRRGRGLRGRGLRGRHLRRRGLHGRGLHGRHLRRGGLRGRRLRSRRSLRSSGASAPTRPSPHIRRSRVLYRRPLRRRGSPRCGLPCRRLGRSALPKHGRRPSTLRGPNRHRSTLRRRRPPTTSPARNALTRPGSRIAAGGSPGNRRTRSLSRHIRFACRPRDPARTPGSRLRLVLGRGFPGGGPRICGTFCRLCHNTRQSARGSRRSPAFRHTPRRADLRSACCGGAARRTARIPVPSMSVAS